MVRLMVDDFFTGLFATLASKGWTGISLRDDSFDKGIVPAFNKLLELAPDHKLEVPFRIRPHRFHGDSITVRNAIYSAAQRGLISLDNPEYQDIRFQIGREQADEILNEIPGGKSLFSALSVEFLKCYDQIAV
jgi:hypothetical protein